MFSRKVIFQLVVVACLAGLILAADVQQNGDDKPQNPVCKYICDACKNVAAQLKEGLPAAKEKIKQLCQNCGAQENVDKCKKKIDEICNDIQNKSPEEICRAVGLCKKSQFFNLLGL